MKRLFLILAFTSIGCMAFGKTTSHSWDFALTGYSLGDSSLRLTDVILGAGYRGITYPQNIGFLYGVDVSLGIPLLIVVTSGGLGGFGISTDDIFLSLKVPFGYRWPGENKNSGFYLSGGPSVHTLVDFSSNVIIGAGIYAELGVESNKVDATGFHFGFQIGWNPILFAASGGYLGVSAWEIAFRFGGVRRRPR